MFTARVPCPSADHSDVRLPPAESCVRVPPQPGRSSQRAWGPRVAALTLFMTRLHASARRGTLFTLIWDFEWNVSALSYTYWAS